MSVTPATPAAPATTAPAPSQHAHREVRVATYNTSLNRASEGKLIADLSAGDEQARNIAAVIQANRPEIVVLNEFDYDANGKAVELFRSRYLGVAQRGQEPIDYPYVFTAPVNTGVASGMDLDRDGQVKGPGDAWGFGQFPGQYGMVILSQHPLDTEQARTFQQLRWAEMPNNRLPYDFYGEAAEHLRLSSKSHWDVPVNVGKQRIHLLVSHPTPPSFDGPEKRNVRRNADEIRLTADYIAGGDRAEWIVDDRGVRGGLPTHASFIIFGDQNADPWDGDGAGGDDPHAGINQLLMSPRVADPRPTSDGAVTAAAAQEGNAAHRNPAELDTADFSDPKPGNLRVDYVLPSQDLDVAKSHVFWPAPDQPLGDLMTAKATSDHRMVVLTLRVPA